MGRRIRREDQDNFEDNRPVRRPRRRRRSGGLGVILLVVALVLPVLGGAGYLVYRVAIRPGEQREQNKERNRTRLIGKWTALVKENPRRRFIYEFRADGVFVLIGTDDAALNVTRQGTWQALSAKGDTIDVHATVPRESKEGESISDMHIEFLSDDRFRYTASNGIVINASRLP